MAQIYDFKLARPDGSELNLADNKGKVMLIVNTASGCGFTPQYEPLEALNKEIQLSGLEIILATSSVDRHLDPMMRSTSSAHSTTTLHSHSLRSLM